MSVMFVVFTILFFLGAETVIQSFRKRKLAPVSSSQRKGAATAMIPEFLKDLEEPEGMFYNPGHTWAFLEMDGTVKIGLDSFFHQVMGKVDNIEVPEVGMEINQSSHAIIVQRAGRKVYVPIPVDGTIATINLDVLQNPEMMLKDPYNTGWLLRIKPHNFMESVRVLKFGREAKKWFAREVHRLRDFLVTQLPAGELAAQTMYDGGLPVFGVSSMLNDEGWENLKQEFFASGEMLPTAH